MTREEALKIWLPVISMGVDKMPELKEALNLAIKALEQEPCEDAISRQAVMNCFKKWQPYMATRLFGFEKELSSLPSVAPQPKTGHWYKTNSGDICYTCSICGVTNASGTKYNYCPHCGAKMESEVLQNDKTICPSI